MKKLAKRIKANKSQKFILCLLFVLILFPSLCFSQQEFSTPKLKDVLAETETSSSKQNISTSNHSQQKKLVKMGPSDKYNRGVPHNSIEGYFEAVKSADYGLAAHYLDLRNLPKGYSIKDGAELSRQLKVILDRSLWVEMDLLSNKPLGHSDDGLPSYRDLVGQIDVEGKIYDILLQRVPRGDGVFIWKFSSKTVRDIPALYQVLGYGKNIEKLSKFIPDFEFLGLKLVQWILLLFIIFIITIISIPILRIISWIIRRKKTHLSLSLSKFINGPFNVVLVLLITRQYFYLIHPSLTARSIFEASTITIIAFIWLLFSAINLFSAYYSQKLSQQGYDNAIVLLSPALTSLKIIITFMCLLFWLDNIGFRISTILAGLGVGGIAIALATQKSIENFIGAITLYLAAPVKVGDFCRFGDKMGTVEEIGLRGSKIRTLENTVINIPNATFSVMEIENYSERKFYRYNPRICLHFNTSSEQIQEILNNIKKSFSQHPLILESPFRVNFIGFGKYSLDIEVHCYIDTVDLNEFKRISEQLNLLIMNIIQSAGTKIAIPASNEYHTQELTSPFEQIIKNK